MECIFDMNIVKININFLEEENRMETFAPYLEKIEDAQQRHRVEEVLSWVATTFPNLGKKIAWNQPMFTDHDTFILGFSIAKHHMAISPEKEGIIQFSDAIKEAGYTHTDNLWRIKWEQPVDYVLLEKIIDYNIADKADCATFWRK